MRRSRGSSAGQPPFADTETITATADAPLTLADALLTPTAASTNNWGVDRDYALGMIQTWNATLTRNLTQDWTITPATPASRARTWTSCARRRSIRRRADSGRAAIHLGIVGRPLDHERRQFPDSAAAG